MHMRQKVNQEGMWHALFKEEDTKLRIAALIIVNRKASTESILHAALQELEGGPFYEAFGLASALRSVVKTALAYNLGARDREGSPPSSAAFRDEDDVELSLMKLPWPERTVYFLCEILKYSRRDTALLLGISDTNVDQLKRLARRRIDLVAAGNCELLPHTFNVLCSAAAAVSRT